MIFGFKIILILFMVVGGAIALYGAWEIWGTVSLVQTSTGKAKAKFVGYHQEYYESTSTTYSPDGTPRSESSFSIASYPEFRYQAANGDWLAVRENKVHVLEIYKTDQDIEILLFPYMSPRLAGFYSLYMRDVLILMIGLGFLLLPLLFWNFALPATERPEVAAAVKMAEGAFYNLLNSKMGPFSVRFILLGSLGLMGSIVLITLIAGLWPYLAELNLGAGGRLIEALKEKRFDQAREMIVKGSGINSRNKYNQTPLLLALEAGQKELAQTLIKAGADVNIKSKMYMTPLRVATQSGDLDMVKQLLSRGASPDAPEDESPPFFYALAKGYDDIARVLIEGGTDLHKRYICGSDQKCTVGDIAVLARKQDLVELIRQRGGSFTQ